MSESRYPNQVAIIEISADEKRTATGYTHPLAAQISYDGIDVFGDVEWPEVAGVYVWTGELWYKDGQGQGEYGGLGDADSGADGELRLATTAEGEIYRLGFLATAARIAELEKALGDLAGRCEMLTLPWEDRSALEAARRLLNKDDISTLRRN